MAIHDPDASSHERQVALKLGRQKRIQVRISYLLLIVLLKKMTNCILYNLFLFQIIDGQQVEVMEDEDGQTQVLAVEGEDGQQYVVLEVIQLQVPTEQIYNKQHIVSYLKLEVK
jgi:hypothetical protein